MAYNNGIVTAPVQTQDVATALGIAETRVGMLCISDAINRWSRYKPVRLSVLLPDRSGDWWKANDGRCGFAVTYTNDYRKIPELYTNNLITKGWDYEHPRGGDSEPYRIVDFDMYFHQALPPFSSFVATEKAANQKAFYFELMSNLKGAPGYPSSVGLEDILSHDNQTTLNDYYLGIVFTKADGTYFRRITATTKGFISKSFTLPSDFVIDQTYKAYPFLSKKQMGMLDTDTAVDNYFYPIPCVSPKEFLIVTAELYSGISIALTGFYVNNTRASVTVQIKNESGASKVINSGTVYLRTSTPGTPLTGDDKSSPIESATIAANSTWSKVYTFTGLNANKYGQYLIHLNVTVDNVAFEKQNSLFLSSIDVPSIS